MPFRLIRETMISKQKQAPPKKKPLKIIPSAGKVVLKLAQYFWSHLAIQTERF